MTPSTLFYILIAILIINFIVDKILDVLNTKHFDDAIPAELADVYKKEEYEKSQAYKKTNAKFSNITGIFSLTLTLAFFFLDGFQFVDELARSYSSNAIVIALIFFGIIIIGSDIINTPFSYYKTFVIEEKFGFNKTTKKTFIVDKIKGLLMTAQLTGRILAVIIWLKKIAGTSLGLHEWAWVAIFS